MIQSNLRVLMAERGLNIKDVKEKTTLSRTTISNLFNNYGLGIQFDTMNQLCKLFDCQPGDLFIFHDIEVIFNDVSDSPKVKVIKSNNKEDSKSYELDLTINVDFSIKYNGELNEGNTDMNFKATFGENKKIRTMYNIKTPEEVVLIIDKINPPFYIKDYITKKHDSFVGEMIQHYIDEYKL